MVITLAACAYWFTCYAVAWFTVFMLLGLFAVLLVFGVGFLLIYHNLLMHRKF